MVLVASERHKIYHMCTYACVCMYVCRRIGRQLFNKHLQRLTSANYHSNFSHSRWCSIVLSSYAKIIRVSEIQLRLLFQQYFGTFWWQKN